MDVVMPKMGESVSEGTLIKWHKKEGDQVKRDEIIFEISTDKVDTEIPSPADGVLTKINVQEGDTVEVGTVVAQVSEGGEAPAAEPAAQAEDIQQAKVKEEKPHEEEVPAEEGKIEVPEQKEAEVKPVSGETIDIAMPKMGESVMEGTIIKWHKKVGEAVKKDETIFEISTDKVDTEVPSPANGFLAEVLVAEQETVEVGTVVARLSTEAAEAKEVKQEVVREKAEQKQPELTKAPQRKEEPESMHDNFSQSAVEEQRERKGTGAFLSPLVLNIARKENVSFDELYKIKGTGLEGRVTKKDILNYIENRGSQKPAEVKPAVQSSAIKHEAPAQEPSKMQPVYSSDQVEKIPMDNIRQKIMQAMINSRDTSVHVSAMLEVDMTKIHNFIQKNRDEYLKKEGVKLTYMPFIANACVKGLKEFPLINAAIEGTNILKKKYINLGIAVAIEPTGLIVPNIKAADERNIIGLAKSINDLAARARTKKLTPDDITNGTFTITNYGVFGTIFGTPIINQPEVAILGVGTVVKKPVVIEVDGIDTIAVKPVMALTLSHDHRLVDGMLGGRFLKFIKDTLENFESASV